MLPCPPRHSSLHLHRGARIRKRRCANLHSLSTCEHEFDGMLGASDSPDADNRKLRMCRPNVKHTANRNSMNR
jgi:hypothetical protein